MITDLENETYSKIKAFDLEFDGENLPYIKCKFDVELIPKMREASIKSYITPPKCVGLLLKNILLNQSVGGFY